MTTITLDPMYMDRILTLSKLRNINAYTIAAEISVYLYLRDIFNESLITWDSYFDQYCKHDISFPITIMKPSGAINIDVKSVCCSNTGGKIKSINARNLLFDECKKDEVQLLVLCDVYSLKDSFKIYIVGCVDVAVYNVHPSLFNPKIFRKAVTKIDRKDLMDFHAVVRSIALSNNMKDFIKEDNKRYD